MIRTTPSTTEYGVVIRSNARPVQILPFPTNSVVLITSRNSDTQWVVEFRGRACPLSPANLLVLANLGQEWCRATQDFQSKDDNHLSYKVGDVLRIIDKTNPSSWQTILHGRYGAVVPQNFEPISETETEYEKFADLLLDRNSKITLALCAAVPVTAADHVAKALINIFEAKGTTFDLLKSVISEEVRTTTNASTLFRANSMASKLLSAYGRITGQDYLHSTLRPLVKWIGASSTSFEIDPSKMVDNDSLEENRKNLMEGAELFFNGIRKSIGTCPPPFRAICHQLQVAVSERFPELKHAVVGGFFFLRFMCPAIISPEGFGVLTEGQVLITEARRALVLVSKLLQNLANGKSFGKKEAYMAPMQDFIDKHEDEIKQFFDDLADVNMNEISMEPLLVVSEEEFGEYIRYVHTQISSLLPKVEEILKKYALENKEDPENPPSFSALKSSLDRLGTPPDEKKQKQIMEGLRREKKGGSSRVLQLNDSLLPLDSPHLSVCPSPKRKSHASANRSQQLGEERGSLHYSTSSNGGKHDSLCNLL